MSSAAATLAPARWRLLMWRHPEGWAMLLSAAAWVSLIAGSGAGGGHSGHTGHGGGPVAVWPALVWHWAMMSAAMMFPMLIGPLRFVAARSFWKRRHRAMALFLGGYLAIWIVYGLLLDAALGWLSPAFASALAAVSFATAAVWQWTPAKRRSLAGCHFTVPLAPEGPRADLDCWRYGMRIGAFCWMSCWALMLACAAAGHALWALIVVTLVAWGERFLPGLRRWPALG